MVQIGDRLPPHATAAAGNVQPAGAAPAEGAEKRGQAGMVGKGCGRSSYFPRRPNKPHGIRRLPPGKDIDADGGDDFHGGKVVAAGR